MESYSLGDPTSVMCIGCVLSSYDNFLSGTRSVTFDRVAFLWKANKKYYFVIDNIFYGNKFRQHTYKERQIETTKNTWNNKDFWCWCIS